PAVVGAEALRIGPHGFTVGEVEVKEGEWISIDGTSGDVVVGSVELSEAEAPEDLEVLLKWADRIRAGRLGVRANADNGEDAANARRLGAEGIGLCRTEHMFLGEDRLPVVRRMILAEEDAEESDALEQLRKVQREDFLQILEAMDGLPVTVRLLDPPLHEFLPSTHELAVKEATSGLDADEQKLYDAARSWQEANPMLGTRGVRLGVLKPGLYEMQVRALMEAAIDRAAAGGHPVIEVMIPLTVSREELALARRWVERAIEGVGTNRSIDVKIGTMIETPRAALRAGDIAQVADFFSFGTNDLTQMTFGFSRDDVEGRMMTTYLDQGLLARNPFETVDAEGVGELVRLAVERGRATRADLKVGVCGEHGGDPASISVFYESGLDYVSCSPYRVPVARLAAAQAVIADPAASAGVSREARPGHGKRQGSPRRAGASRGRRRG
ncbi:MAG: putative PEP-binding protein, partial [Acidimicrobiales bacterium]